MRRFIVQSSLTIALALLLAITPGSAQMRTPAKPSIRPPTSTSRPTATTFTPRFAAVAETRLLMEGLTQANYRSLNRLLAEKPKDEQTWTFARGQAILIAESGNLLLLRPPRNSGRDTWMKLAMSMRDKATQSARDIAAMDFVRSRQALVELTASCNRCHETFRVPVKVAPERLPGERDAE